MVPFSSVTTRSRLGFHYFPDTYHYRLRDLDKWLPELKRMGVSWLTLLAPAERAIPEYFIRGLLEDGIQPILHFQLPLRQPVPHQALRLLLRSYARWGVQWTVFFDRPNYRINWQASEWVQADLVERFLDLFLPCADSAFEEGLVPIFPPLQPGGDYWDLSFLQSALRGLIRRGNAHLLETLALSTYAWIGHKPLEWGSGGPERWPLSRPYSTPPGSEDHLGFRIFEWYLEIARREMGRFPPIFLLRAGAVPDDRSGLQDSPDIDAHTELNLAAARLMAAPSDDASGGASIPEEVRACCFWLLSAGAGSELAAQAWFSPEGKRLPVVQGFYRLGAQAFLTQLDSPDPNSASLAGTASADAETTGPENDPAAPIEKIASARAPAQKSSKPLSHYVLLPLYAWGAANWDLEAIQPLIQETHPTVGFSLAEARLASRVTVVGGEGAISEDALLMLRENGCVVERVREDGTLVAS